MPDKKPSKKVAHVPIRDQIIVGFDRRLGEQGLVAANKVVETTMTNLAKLPITILESDISQGPDGSAFFAAALIHVDDPKLGLPELKKLLKGEKQKYPGVAWLERNAPIRLAGFNDQYFREQWALPKLGVMGPWAPQIPAPPPPPPVPPSTVPKTLVAIIDSGLRLTDGNVHEDIGSVEPLADCQPAGFFDDNVDMDGHGTLLAGTILTKSNNTLGIASVIPSDWHVSLLPVKFFDGGGEPSVWNARTAIQHAVTKGAKVINASWHVALGDGDKNILREAIKFAKDADRLVVVAAGNDGTNNEIYPTYPANYGTDGTVPGLKNFMLTVAATGPDDSKASFSNYGPTVADIAAPGAAIKTTGRYLPYAPQATARYPEYNGTSASTAFVSAGAALVYALNPGWKPKEVITHLKASADIVPGLVPVCEKGQRLNLRRAVHGPLKVIAPVMADVLNINVAFTIKWQNEYDQPNFDRVRIEYSKDDGQNWRELHGNRPNPAGPGIRTFVWTPEVTASPPVDDRTPGAAMTGIIRITPKRGNFPALSGKFKVV